MAFAALLLAAGLLLAGCTGASDSESASSAEGGASTEQGPALAAPDSGAATEDTGDTTAGTGAAPVLGSVDPASAEVIRTASLAVEVEQVRMAADRAAQLVREAGGGVVSEQADAAGDAAAVEGGRSELVLRVPPERFDAVLTQLADLGQERSRSVGVEDVTDQVVDLESRLATQRASVERVRALLDQAVNLGEVVQIEGELTQRTADLESLQARLESLRAQVDRSTITLSLYTEQGAPPVAAGGFLDGLRSGWDALLGSARVLAVVSGALLPFVPVLLIAAFVTARVRSRGRTTGST